MPRIRDFATSENTGTTTVHSGNLPVYEPGDLLIWSIVRDGTGNITGAPAAWGNQLVNIASAGVRHAVYAKEATVEEPRPGVSTSSTDTWHSTMISIANASASIDLAEIVSQTNGVSQRFSSPDVSTTTPNNLILYFIGQDGNTGNPTNFPGTMHILGQDAGTPSHGCAWSYLQVTGSAPTANFFSQTRDDGTKVTIAIRPSSSYNDIPGYVDPDSIPASIIHPLNGNAAVITSYPFSASFFTANNSPGQISGSIGSKTFVFDAWAATSDYGLNPYLPALNSSPPTTAITSTTGNGISLTGSLDLSGKLVIGSMLGANPRDLVDIATIAEVGVLFVIRSAPPNSGWLAYQVSARNSRPNFLNSGRQLYSVYFPYTGSVYASGSGTFDVTDVNRFYWMTSNPRGALVYYLNYLCVVNPLVVVGGSSDTPATLLDLIACGNSYLLPVISGQGASAALSYTPIQLGGSRKSYWDLNATTIQFPKTYDPISKQISFHAPDSVLGITYKGLQNDVIKHRNSIITSDTPFYWVIDPTATGSYDFSGLQVIGAKPVTLGPVTVNNAIFSRCGGAYISGAILSSVTFDSCVDAAALVVSSSTQMDNVIGCTFSNNTVGITLTSVGTYTFDGNLFSGNTYDVRNASTGSITIQAVNGSNVSTVQNTNGGATTIVNSVTLTITGIVSGSEIRIYSGSDDVEVAGQESVAPPGDFEYAYDASLAGTPVDIVVHSVNYQHLRISDYELGAENSSLPVQQIFDRNYI